MHWSIYKSALSFLPEEKQVGPVTFEEAAARYGAYQEWETAIAAPNGNSCRDGKPMNQRERAARQVRNARSFLHPLGKREMKNVPH
jgi:hypothetical protein